MTFELVNVEDLVVVLLETAFAFAFGLAVVAVAELANVACSGCCVKVGICNDDGEVDDDAWNGACMLCSDFVCSSFPIRGDLMFACGKLPLPPVAKRPINVCRAAARAAFAFAGSVVLTGSKGCFRIGGSAARLLLPNPK